MVIRWSNEGKSYCSVVSFWNEKEMLIDGCLEYDVSEVDEIFDNTYEAMCRVLSELEVRLYREYLDSGMSESDADREAYETLQDITGFDVEQLNDYMGY